jgi:lipid-A-disaccharide synthase-like uncharacterized protein
VAGIFPFSLSYLALIVWYHPRRRTLKWRIAGILAAMAAGTGLLYGAVYAAVGTGPVARTILGSAAVVVNIGLFSSPVAAVYTAYREMDASRVPVTFTVVALACASLWAVFGILVGDVFLVIPNGVGALISLAQLVVLGVIKYRRGKAAGGGKGAVGDAATGASTGGAAAVPAAAGGRDVEAGGKPAAPGSGGGAGLAAAASQHEVDAEPVMVMTATVPPTAVLHVVPKSREYSYSFADAASGGLGELAPPRPLGGAAAAAAARPAAGKAASAGGQLTQQPSARAPSLAAAASKSASLFTSSDGLMTMQSSSSSANLVDAVDRRDNRHQGGGGGAAGAAAAAGTALAPISAPHHDDDDGRGHVVGLHADSDDDDGDGGGESVEHIVRAVSRSLQQLSAAAAGADGGVGAGRTRGASRVSSPALRAAAASSLGGAVPATPKLD